LAEATLIFIIINPFYTQGGFSLVLARFGMDGEGEKCILDR
jgi:hypothetical protein